MRRGGINARSAAAAKQEVEATQQKFSVGQNPLEQERFLKVLEPRYEKSLARMCELMAKYENTGGAERGQAVEMWRMQIAQGAFSDQVKLEFIRRFYYWLLGRGTDADTKRTFWGRGNAAEYNAQVRAYIEMFVDKRNQYAQQLALLANRVPSTLRGYYLYFKYIVDGRIFRAKDAKGSYWDMGPEDFLDDFEMFFSEFGDDNNRLLAPDGDPDGRGPGGPNSNQTHPHPGPPYAGDFSTMGVADAVVERMAALFNARDKPTMRRGVKKEKEVDDADYPENVEAMNRDDFAAAARQAAVDGVAPMAEEIRRSTDRQIQVMEQMMEAMSRMQQPQDFRQELRSWGPELIAEVEKRIPRGEPAKEEAGALGKEIIAEIKKDREALADRFKEMIGEINKAGPITVENPDFQKWMDAQNAFFRDYGQRLNEMLNNVQQGMNKPADYSAELGDLRKRIEEANQANSGLARKVDDVRGLLTHKPDTTQHQAQIAALEKRASGAEAELRGSINHIMGTMAQFRDIPDVDAFMRQFEEQLADQNLSSKALGHILNSSRRFMEQLAATAAAKRAAANTPPPPARTEVLRVEQENAERLRKESDRVAREAEARAKEEMRAAMEAERAARAQAEAAAKGAVARAEQDRLASKRAQDEAIANARAAQAAEDARRAAEQLNKEMWEAGSRLQREKESLQRQQAESERILRERAAEEKSRSTRKASKRQAAIEAAQKAERQIVIAEQEEEAALPPKEKEEMSPEIKREVKRERPEEEQGEPAPVEPPAAREPPPLPPRRAPKALVRRYQLLEDQAMRFKLPSDAWTHSKSSWREEPPENLEQMYDELMAKVKQADADQAARVQEVKQEYADYKADLAKKKKHKAGQ